MNNQAIVISISGNGNESLKVHIEVPRDLDGLVGKTQEAPNVASCALAALARSREVLEAEWYTPIELKDPDTTAWLSNHGATIFTDQLGAWVCKQKRTSHPITSEWVRNYAH